jgi:tRNA modification GTPase
VAICGKPNVGKSSLFNCLLDEDRALVSEFAGTTRDSIDSSIIINGIQVRLIDTAGVRDTDDFVESMGIEKTKEVAAKADYIFYVVSPELESFEADVKYLEGYSDKKIVLILNKADLMDSAGDFAKNVLKQQFRNDVLIASSKNRDVFSVIEFLKNELGQETVQKDVVITNHRQFESLDSALRAVAKATENLKDGYGAEVASLDLKDAYLHLQNVVGSSYDDQVIDKIFKEFCLGK